MRLGIEVTYVVNYNISKVRQLQKLIDTQKKWNADDWVKHYSEKGPM